MAEQRVAVFAGGCFWSVEAHFDKMPGVIATVSGFSGGTVANPSYERVLAGDTGHLEAVEVTYDSAKVTYDQLLYAFWHFIDPTDGGGQFCDRGNQYETAIFYGNDAEKQAAETSKLGIVEELRKDIATKIIPALPFYAAEPYHQDFASKNPARYEAYRVGCGRDVAIRSVWGERAFAGLPPT
ncbi:peptide-methionine (S)-S-oxide reductase MsrA [Aureimonas fodinaquatilis]|nr:peptide-methionine (S)-S-oxide reductase MsrA [Aureimonas fodinaquatilis]